MDTLRPPCSFTGSRYRRQQQGNQNANDCYDDEKFYNRKIWTTFLFLFRFFSWFPGGIDR
ncbi:MAG: hypothetical protein FWH27_00960 [Planctomycetaceae bacterium]|nr:hypothetical protein [Planctomycetaceae bacterium]